MIRAETQTDLVRVDDGAQGPSGNDASIEVSKVGDTATITAISGDGTVTTATVNDGTNGKSAYEAAVDGGYAGTEATFNTDLAEVSEKAPLTIIREYDNGVLVGKTGQTVGALVNANGTFDVVGLIWNDGIPTANNYPLATFGLESQIGYDAADHIEMDYSSFKMVDSMGFTYVDFRQLRNEAGNVMGPIVETIERAEVTINPVIGEDLDDPITYDIEIPTKMPPLSPMVEPTAVITIKHNGATMSGIIGVVIEIPPSPSNRYTYYDYVRNRQVTITMNTKGVKINVDEATKNTITNSSIFTVSYYTISPYAKAFTVGFRQGNVGALSFVGGGMNNTASGFGSSASGFGTEAVGDYSHTEGYYTDATGHYGAHAEGTDTIASGDNSHAEGEGCESAATGSHAEGAGTYASGIYAHAEGSSTTASGESSHAEGLSTTASGNNSHAAGEGTVADGEAQTVIGKYNDNDNNNAFEIGNGNYGNPSNALAVDWNGRIQCGDYQGNLTSIFDLFYPVGSYYETSDSTFNPNTAWGGTWILETAGQVHISSGTGYTVSGALTNTTDGGAATVTLTSGQSGNQQLSYTDTTYKLNTTSRKPGTSTAVAYGTSITGTATTRNIAAKNATTAHENMPPYIVVNRWHRTA